MLIFKRTVKNIIDFKKKKCYRSQKIELNSNQDATEFYICRKKIIKKLAKDKNHQKDHYHYIGKYRGAVHSICNWRFDLP